MNPINEHAAVITRRHLLGQMGLGVGAAALGTLFNGTRMSGSAHAALPDPLAPTLPHFPAKAKRVIYLFQNGGPSHVDLFDYKPKLLEFAGQGLPAELTDGKRFSTMTSGQEKAFLPEITKFARHGDCGKWVAGNFMPRTAEIVDDLCFVQSMTTTQVNHAPAITYFLTGSELPGKPSMGAWLTYGLGSETENLPAFTVMTSRDRQASCGQIFYDFYWGNGFLPSKYQGVKFRGAGDPVLYLSNPNGISRSMRRSQLDDLAALNQMNMDRLGDPEIAARIAQYEMAYKMQTSVPELTDMRDEPQHVLDMYGPQVNEKGSFAYNCLMARRLAERGCRFIQLMHAGWDQHTNLDTQLEIQCQDTDAPSAALVKDLQQRGLLEDTLVIWGGEFGRTPFQQNRPGANRGRDHHPYAFSLWMAGGGVKPGITYGESDDFGFNVANHPVQVHDLQATILHLLGIDHARFTHRFQGLDQRLTGVEEAHVVHDILS
ncbi:hypothetical protein Pla52o_51920 [Novipirellula galeiformis]|uniref:Sulfatase n=1 Tax=Novipirellula galeiformis TaxID=2528004 RepID=A0A5C6BZU0_9BACT|nr:DUF1501 domain-containing protein [Novipirellula galeiformis]TWU17388.1 hypothetical protein Pla52o_51920 [Novipirellula galeiformis]